MALTQLRHAEGKFSSSCRCGYEECLTALRGCVDCEREWLPSRHSLYPLPQRLILQTLLLIANATRPGSASDTCSVEEVEEASGDRPRKLLREIKYGTACLHLLPVELQDVLFAMVLQPPWVLLSKEEIERVREGEKLHAEALATPAVDQWADDVNDNASDVASEASQDES